MEICRPFAPILGADIINEKHEKISGIFTDANKDENAVQVSKDRRILERYPILKEILLNKFYGFIKESNLNYNNKFDISTSWLTKSENKQQCVKHSHKNCFYSGVYYYDKYSENTSQIAFLSPVSSFSDFWLSPTEFVIQISDQYNFTPTKNLLLLFPSYLRHKVEVHHEEDTRYSLAFNFVPIGEYGSEDSLYNTSWFR